MSERRARPWSSAGLGLGLLQGVAHEVDPGHRQHDPLEGSVHTEGRRPGPGRGDGLAACLPRWMGNSSSLD